MVICKYFQQGCCKYGANCRFEHVFGSKYSYSRGLTQPNAGNQNVFNQGGGNSAASSLFRSAVQSSAPPSSVFTPAPVSRPSVFNRLGHQPNSFVPHDNHAASVFAQASQNVFRQANAQPQNSFTSSSDQFAKSVFAQANQNVFAQANKNVFAQANQNVFAQANQNVFAQANQNVFSQANQNVFAQANQNVFAPTQHHSVVPQQSNAANLFASAAKSAYTAQSTPSHPSPSNNVFHISKPTNVFAAANSSFDLCDDSLYSILEELSKSDIDAFEGAEFKLGCIPELPPPRTMCV